MRYAGLKYSGGRYTYAGVLMCGSGARRGGAVSGLGGHNAAMAAIELLRG